MSGRTTERVVSLATVAAVALLATLPASSARASIKNCAVRGAEVVVQSETARVMIKRTSNVEGSDRLYGCLLRSKKARVLAKLDVLSRYSEGVKAVVLAGRYAAFNRYGGGGAAQCYSRIVVADLRTGTLVDRAEVVPTGHDLCGSPEFVLAASGALVWIDSATASSVGPPALAVHVADSAGERIVGTGAIMTGSLALSMDGKTAYWMAGGQTRSTAIG